MKPLVRTAILAAGLTLGLTGHAVAADEVDVRDNEFAPVTLEVAEGTTVTWSQSGTAPHSVTAADGSFDSHPDCNPQAPTLATCMSSGDTYSRTFSTPGEVVYYCKVHGTSGGLGMAGTIVVEAEEDSEAAGGGSGGGSSSKKKTKKRVTQVLPSGSSSDMPRTGVGTLMPFAAVLLGVSAAGARALRRR